MTPALLRTVADALPDAWLPDDQNVGAARAQRHAYVEWLSRRLADAELFEEEADRARTVRV